MLAAKHLALKEGRFFAVSAPDGAMRPESPDGHGVWDGDTRILSEYRLSVDRQEPKVGEIRAEGGWIALDGTAGGLRVMRERFVDGGLHERVTIINPGQQRIDGRVELSVGADFAAMLVVRGILRSLPPHAAAPVIETARGALLKAGDDAAQATEVLVRPPGLQRPISLGPNEEMTFIVDVLPGAGRTVPDFDAGLRGIRAAYRTWSSGCAAFETDNPTLNGLLQQSRDDMRMLCDRYPTGIYPTGGLPWFAVPFGRDALITSLFALPMNPDLARGALRFLAAHQGRRVDPATEEEPGKILHEVRTGEVVDRGLWPHILYGTVDATPLYLCVLGDTLDWTGDAGTFDELWPTAEAALAWCDTYGDPDHDGYLEHSAGIEARNQGWKDSNDSLTNVDGTDATRPAALCEVQGYLYRALLMMARKRPELKARAAELKLRFNRDFWMPRESFVAQALDGRDHPMEAMTSNAGHCLWAGLLPGAQARAVASRLVAPDMFSGWGIRTLSTRAINYDPCSYHNGSVWAHDNAIAAAGMRVAGFPVEAEIVARSILEAGMAYPDLRPPELWCGNERGPGSKPDDYHASCSPQNWAAASSFSMMTTLLGLEADAAQGRLRIAPVETRLWKRLEVTGLHFAGHRLDFSVDGTRVRLGKVPPGIKVDTPA